MRKLGFIIIGTLVCLTFTACGSGASSQNKTVSSATQESKVQQEEANTSHTLEGKSEDPSQGQTAHEADDPQNEAGKQSDSSRKVAQGSLRVLGNRNNSCLSDTGYYYVTENSSELKKDFYGRQIMYMDFAAKQEVYLCNEPGCKHNDKNCTAVLSGNELGDIGSALLFVWKEKLYLISRDSDTENSMSTIWEEGEDGSSNQRMPTVIYSMGLDGTNRKKEYTFAQDVTVEDMVLCDEDAVYFTAKQINTSSKKGTTYTTASKRELVRYQPEKKTLETVCSLEFGDQIRWSIVGCCDGKVILQGTKYNKKLSLEEEMKLEKEELWEYSNDFTEIFASLDLADGSQQKIYSVKNDPDSENSTVVQGDYLYLSVQKEKKICKINLKTGKVETLAKIEQGFIAGSLSDKLCCRSWDLAGDHTYYFVDCNTGKIDHSNLVNKRNGWDLEIIGESGSQVLVIYDYEGKEAEDDAWDISRYQYGLIEKKDLCQGADQFHKIAMKGAGK